MSKMSSAVSSAVTVDALEPRRLFAAALVPIKAFPIIEYAPVPAPLVRFKAGVLYVDGGRASESIRANVVNGKLSFYATPAVPPGSGIIEDTSTGNATDRFFVNTTGGGYAFVNAPDSSVTLVDTGGGSTYAVADGGDGRRVVTINPIGGYDLADIHKIVISTGGGNDEVLLGGLNIPAEIHGGDGDDTLAGGSAADTLFGDAGRDDLTGNGGRDLLVGGNGNDALHGNKGRDTLLGQGGNDTLSATTAKAVINGGAGIDTVSLAAAPDAIAGAENTAADSRLRITPLHFAPAAATATLRRSGNGLALDASLTLPTSGFAVDWDLTKNSKGEVIADATVYIRTGGSGQAFTNYPTTFDLGQNLVRRSVTVRVRQGGQDVLTGHALVTKSFGSESFSAGDETLSTGDVTVVAV